MGDPAQLSWLHSMMEPTNSAMDAPLRAASSRTVHGNPGFALATRFRSRKTPRSLPRPTCVPHKICQATSRSSITSWRTDTLFVTRVAWSLMFTNSSQRSKVSFPTQQVKGALLNFDWLLRLLLSVFSLRRPAARPRMVSVVTQSWMSKSMQLINVQPFALDLLMKLTDSTSWLSQKSKEFEVLL